ncbi:hypothetical protein CHLNCDRAFT_133886 [Chlorella variabilis]|uniref:Uncharacterized protein n=1 Tax=Chlorella variabilis TaxID=554065 RepID=E1ZEI1_CHLVA|nr:hypothetical protein CHLNCDRAFT_133886 [Chlorella variabilis]EFN55666.1 hypothetical protein CHLNCDRAFT_133886 [Chlorella variabilis]|eukprot:XP_005847768.1 hypothetical protein CHLNCDRAFT_133886 [Chlorella variabilis]
MVGRPTAFFWGVSVLTAAGIYAIHLTQLEEREKLHKGVIRDEAMYKTKKQQLLAGQLRPAEGSGR